MTTSGAVHKKAADLAKLVVRMTAEAGSGHTSTALSLAHLVIHLMYRRMRYDLSDPRHGSADRLVLSGGHGVPIIYAAYADLEGTVGRDGEQPARLTREDLNQLRSRQSVLDGHPNPAEGFPFFDAATGSLGQGLSVAAGLALAAKLDGTDRRVYALIGDGESREGQIWEAADFIVDYRLNNVCAVFNCNGQGQAGDVSPQQSPERIAAKLEAFGWKTTTIDGHDPALIAEVFARVGRSERPIAIVARTVKGWGVAALQEGNWHGKPLKMSQVEAANQSIDNTVAGLFDAEAELPGPMTPIPARTPAREPRSPAAVTWPAFAEAMQSAGFGSALEQGKLATRKGYGAALKVAGDLLPQVVALDGDVSNSTFSEIFAKAYPDRFFECKIAEQNMVSVAVGLSAAGYIPFVNSFAKFIARACDQIEMASISRANIKLVGSHAGVSIAADGPSQMGLLDVGYFRGFTAVRGDDRENPLCWLFHPADAVAAYHCTRLMTELPGMCYMRTHRPDVPLVYDPQTTFQPGGFHVLATGDELAIVTAGYMVHVARQAIDRLAEQDVRATLVDAYSLPLDGERLLETLRRAGQCALVVEDNYGGGLGAAVAEIAAHAGDVRVETLCCRRIPKSTLTAEDMLDYCGIGAAQIAEHALAARRPAAG